MPSGILGLMSCKMRRLQLTRMGGAHTRLLAQYVPSSTRHLLLQTFSSPSSGCPLTVSLSGMVRKRVLAPIIS